MENTEVFHGRGGLCDQLKPVTERAVRRFRSRSIYLARLHFR